MVSVSIWQSLFNAAGLAGLGLTVWYARSSATAAQVALGVAKETSARELRAYLGIKRAWIDATTDPVRAWFDIENFGETPASGVFMKTTYNEIVQPHKFGILDPGNPQSALVPTQISHAALRNGNARCHVDIVIEYTDIFDREWIRRAAFFLLEGVWKEGEIKLYVFPNSADERAKEK